VLAPLSGDTLIAFGEFLKAVADCSILDDDVVLPALCDLKMSLCASARQAISPDARSKQTTSVASTLCRILNLRDSLE
jgi:hypothetical protein